MVRSARLKLALLGAAVVLTHIVVLEWMARAADQISGLTLMAPPMYTRMLQPAAPPPVVAMAAPPAQPKPRAAQRPRPPASSAEQLQQQREADAARERLLAAEMERIRRELAQEREREREEAQAKAAQPAASAAAAAASAPAPEAASLDRWPVDTRLSYKLGGHFRGPLYGDARVQWQREDDRYQVRLDVRIQVFGTQVLTSQGEVTPEGLIPRTYEELRPGKRRTARIGDEVVTLDNGRTVPRPDGVQDTASQFVELSQRFATGREVLEVGRAVSVWLARPGGVDRWTYDVVAVDVLDTPSFGKVEAFHLKPRPLNVTRGNITAEMWFAPSLQYLPVRIKVLMGDEAHLDLMVDFIEQK